MSKKSRAFDPRVINEGFAETKEPDRSVEKTQAAEEEAEVASTIDQGFTDTIPEQEIPTPIEPKKEPNMSDQSEPKKVIPASKTISLEPTATKQSTNVDKLNILTAKFDEAYDKKESTISALIGICNYLNTTNDPKVFNTFVTWFAQRSDTSMDDTKALLGIHTIQNKKTKTRVEATHQCFVELIRVLKSRPRSRYRFTVKAMRAMEISEHLAQWIQQKAVS